MGSSQSKSATDPKSTGPPLALPTKASFLELIFQPAFDYDTDGCYPTPAIGVDGRIAPGLPLGGTTASGCRDESRLANTNSYSRFKCCPIPPTGGDGNGGRGGWCGIMYTLYFEKDQVSWGPGSAGHRNDWEHVVVWVKVVVDANGPGDGELRKRSQTVKSTIEYVSTSNHGSFTVHNLPSPILFDNSPSSPAYPPQATNQSISQNTHAKVVYHKDGASTHCFRLANNHDDPPENHRHEWQYPALVGWNDGYPSFELRNKLSNADFGAANFGIKDASFGPNLLRAMPKEVKEAGFDVNAKEEFVWLPDEGLVPAAAGVGTVERDEL